MTLGLWCLIFIIHSAYCWWIIGYGGAKWVAGWKSFFLIDWIALDWNAEQIRMYVLLIWLASLVYFILAIINPELRVF
ncbi:hypothetical protein H4W00_002340 [Psychrobacter sp. PL19]|jgi:hypothetical protein|uniref:hypothetical protein n=1 Tax=Psychrobacter sp. PL19 TaxID=2760711 RepID=UPI001AE38129